MKTAEEILEECKIQLNYLSDKFGKTGTTASVISKIDNFLNESHPTTLPSDAMQFAELHQYKLEEHDEGGYIGINEKKFAELLEKYASAKIAEMERERKADLRNKLSPFTNLIVMIENGLVEGTVDAHKLISEEIKQCKINIAILTTP